MWKYNEGLLLNHPAKLLFSSVWILTVFIEINMCTRVQILCTSLYTQQGHHQSPAGAAHPPCVQGITTVNSCCHVSQHRRRKNHSGRFVKLFLIRFWTVLFAIQWLFSSSVQIQWSFVQISQWIFMTGTFTFTTAAESVGIYQPDTLRRMFSDLKCHQREDELMTVSQVWDNQSAQWVPCNLGGTQWYRWMD